jgi:hypothetical protein
MAYRKEPKPREAGHKPDPKLQSAILDSLDNCLDRSPIPLPSHALSLYIGQQNGEEVLICHIPPAHGTRGHKIVLRTNQIGFQNLIAILRAQDAASARGDYRRAIGNPAAPIQYMLELLEREGKSLLASAQAEAQAQREASRKAAARVETFSLSDLDDEIF